MDCSLPDRQQEQKRVYYRPELDVLRFWCFAVVFLHHALPRVTESFRSAIVDAGAFGVPVFFLLSAFLITELLIREQLRTSSIHLKAFYIRRILRIWPLYFSFFVLCWLLGRAHLLYMYPIPGKMTLFYLLLAGNWYFVFYGIPANAVMILWSISIEEQFYLVWPWIMRLGTNAVKYGSVGIITLSYATLYFLARSGASAGTSFWTNTFVQMQFFALGGLLALYLNARAFVLSTLARFCLLATTASTWCAAAYFCRLKRSDLLITPQHACIGYLLVAIGAVCMFLAFYGRTMSRGRFARAAIYLGKISFGLYTFHYLAIELVLNTAEHLFPHTHIPLRTLFAFPITVALAACSYRFLEAPALRLKNRFTFVHSRPV